MYAGTGGIAVDAEHVPDAEGRSSRVDRLADCLVRARQGDLTALDNVVVELNPLLWHVARSQGLIEEDAADVVQTIWLELVRQLHAIRSAHALTSWLVRATKREAWHVNARRRKRQGLGIDALAEFPDLDPGPADRVAAQERHRILWRHFAALSQRCRILLTVIAHGDRPDYAAIAETLDMPHGSIGPTRGRCLARLREKLLADPGWSVA